MPKDGFRKINIFIAAPSDVATEKATIISIVEQLNHGLADRLGIVMEVKEWSQVMPSMGRSQKIIFDQLPAEQWDVMIGILWLRYGTPSGGLDPDQSGTHEEFAVAYENWKNTGKPHIMFYQCIRPPEDLKKIDHESLAKISSFFKQFETGGENQGLYRTYNKINEFEGLVRNHLEQTLFEFYEQGRTEATVLPNEEQQDSPQPIVNILSEYYDHFDDQAKRPDFIFGVPTGFIDLDKLTNGLQPANLLVAASRSGESKTSFLLSIARNAALTHRKHIAIFLSLGMTSQNMVQHLIAQETGIETQRLSVGKLEEKEWPLFTHAIEVIADAQIFIDDTPRLTYHELREKSRRLHLEHGLDLIIVDNLQLLRKVKDPKESKNNSDYIDLKILAHELNVPILTGLQLTRAGTQRADKRPILSDLNEFPSLEEAADVIMFIYQPDMYDIDAVKQNIAEIIVAKHSFGYIGSVELIFRNSLFKFENATTRVIKQNDS
jgi:replicative DNA helicase